jgi:hypothetical protein
MTNEDSLAFASIEELATLLAKRKVSPVELTELFLRRIERHNPSLNAFLTVTAEHALAAAHRAEKEMSRTRRSIHRNRLLLGIPIALKDNICTRGIRTTAGSRILRDFVPPEDATVARKLGRAGAILLGKTNMNEFAYGITGNNAHYGPAHNPWALDRMTGGSSAGSTAAVAAGLCVASVGTDTGGSGFPRRSAELWELNRPSAASAYSARSRSRPRSTMLARSLAACRTGRSCWACSPDAIRWTRLPRDSVWKISEAHLQNRFKHFIWAGPMNTFGKSSTAKCAVRPKQHCATSKKTGQPCVKFPCRT